MHVPKLLPSSEPGKRSSTRSRSVTAVPRPRVLRVVTRLSVEGPARQALYLTAALPDRGFDARLVWGPSGKDEGRVDPPTGLPNTYLPYLGEALAPMDDFRAQRELTHILRRWRPQIVHTHMAKAGALGRIAARRASVPITVHTFHGDVHRSYVGQLKNKAFATIERELGKRTDALVTEASWVRDDLLALGIGRPEQWHVVPVGADLDPSLSLRPDQRTSRASLGLPSDGAIIGCVAATGSIQGHATFLEAARRAADLYPGVTFAMAPAPEHLKTAARRLLGERVVFTEGAGDLPAFYAACDVVTLTSQLEGIPMALLEASAAGKPVVATRTGGVREAVRDGNTGWLVSPDDPAASAANITALLADLTGAKRMGEEGAIWVRNRFGQERLADDLTQLYSQLLARKRRYELPARVE